MILLKCFKKTFHVLAMSLEESRRSQRPYRYGMVLLCVGALINWLGLAENYVEPVRYVGVACIVAGALLICAAMCCWLHAPPTRTSTHTQHTNHPITAQTNIILPILQVSISPSWPTTRDDSRLPTRRRWRLERTRERIGRRKIKGPLRFFSALSTRASPSFSSLRLFSCAAREVMPQGREQRYERNFEFRHVNPNMSVTSIALRQTANCFRTKALGANFEKQFAGTDG
ncbi:hypothetical protein ALC57_00956 [Trachymyrmex cornetzi]|uniref:Uncharacterized protein n=1 Tax=Trachymyrmex cornetzi TaxID=471704 RepID=A0A195END1_9HYME|nr:hypothetical protein ALC57_00956 [Trachymyrmex cornetzi]